MYRNQFGLIGDIPLSISLDELRVIFNYGISSSPTVKQTERDSGKDRSGVGREVSDG